MRVGPDQMLIEVFIMFFYSFIIFLSIFMLYVCVVPKVSWDDSVVDILPYVTTPLSVNRIFVKISTKLKAKFPGFSRNLSH